MAINCFDPCKFSVKEKANDLKKIKIPELVLVAPRGLTEIAITRGFRIKFEGIEDIFEDLEHTEFHG